MFSLGNGLTRHTHFVYFYIVKDRKVLTSKINKMCSNAYLNHSVCSTRNIFVIGLSSSQGRVFCSTCTLPGGVYCIVRKDNNFFIMGDGSTG